MKRKGTTVLALVCGLVCAGSVFLYTQGIEAQVEAQRSEALAKFGGEQVEVYVASRDIAVGEIVNSSNVVTRLWLVDLLPEHPVTDFSEVEGKQVTSSLLAGEVLSEARFETTGNLISVPKGLSAVGVELNSAQAVAGALEIGALVDVYASGANETVLIAERVLVASVAEGSAGRFFVTLAVAPEHVEEIIATTQSAALYLALPAKQEGKENV